MTDQKNLLLAIVLSMVVLFAFQALFPGARFVEDGAPGFDILGIAPTAVEAIVPTYLDQYRPRGRFRRAKMA